MAFNSFGFSVFKPTTGSKQSISCSIDLTLSSVQKQVLTDFHRNFHAHYGRILSYQSHQRYRNQTKCGQTVYNRTISTFHGAVQIESERSVNTVCVYYLNTVYIVMKLVEA